jgi:signal transduction histidine kinase
MTAASGLAPTAADRLPVPAWWRSGVRTRWWWASLVAVAVAQSLDTVGINGRGGYTPGLIAEANVSFVAETAIGFLFWMWRPKSILGPLLVGWITLYELNDLPVHFPESRAAWTVFFLASGVYWALYIHMLFVFPTGRIWAPLAWLIVGFWYVWMSVEYVPDALFSNAQPLSYVYVGRGWSGLGAWHEVWPLVVIVAWFATAALLVVRLVRATPGSRRRLLPLYGLVVTFFTFNLTYNELHASEGTPWAGWFLWEWNYGPLLSAAAAVFGLAAVKRKRSAVADLVVELDRAGPGQVQQALAHTLGDPFLELGLWLPEQQSWVEANGQPLTVPEDGSRGVTYVGERLAVMLHDRDLLDQPRLLEAVGSAGRLALENERMHAEVRAELQELRESRTRIVRAADEERRRLDRDLHDGAQQRLLGLGMGLSLLRGREWDGEKLALIAELELELREALAELRELARGIHPAVLTDRGLDAAVQTLAERSPVPVAVQPLGERLQPHVETAAYFVVAEALANVAKYAGATHASVNLIRSNSGLRIEVCDDGVGGADPRAGTGLRGLADRVGALDGELRVDSPVGGGTTVTATIPGV